MFSSFSCFFVFFRLSPFSVFKVSFFFLLSYFFTCAALFPGVFFLYGGSSILLLFGVVCLLYLPKATTKLCHVSAPSAACAQQLSQVGYIHVPCTECTIELTCF